MPPQHSQHNPLSKIKFKISKKVESLCQCNQKSCLICARKRSSSMLSIKNSLVVDESSPVSKRTIDQKAILVQQAVVSKQISRQQSNHVIHHSYYSGKQINNTTSTTMVNNSRTRKTSLESSPPKENVIGRHSFKFLYVIGKGGFGKVWRVEMRSNRQEYALKEMLKSKIISKRSVNSVMNEKYLLEHLKHPFLVNMHYAYQDRENLYLVLDLLRGGDLRYHIGRNTRFSEEQTKFFVCCILLALQYLHQNGIIHRDVKPENLVFDKDGFLRLTDLGVARLNKDSTASDTSGTPGYMAPEVMCRLDHSFPVDYYALGVIAYELLLGKRPYNGKNRQEIRDQILAKQVQIKDERFSLKAQDFINRLLIRKPQQRLGNNGIEEIFEHQWLKGYPWGKLINREIKSQYVPGSIDGNFDFQSQISADSEPQEDAASLIRRKSVQCLFEGYKFQ
ncbi:unnamed protein product (macronuclear) [Paramecium tetraurelia]|uniref:non-specific serine/threonine protein kinase n=1 Tax=Paramecium tetraurelia TaxID=5888 RepID=A0DFG8_PARTE|nr:uncharacterized protein GSPATT00016598001 [Paramecium tetraurelia]CAK81785.1 unnamed protein product [Paramecium tetraurelia]|eukprot:XP_001449182.1 hypothetical protein (macronuclear) [Paramecium tetraurelia strain d4-2]